MNDNENAKNRDSLNDNIMNNNNNNNNTNTEGNRSQHERERENELFGTDPLTITLSLVLRERNVNRNGNTATVNDGDDNNDNNTRESTEQQQQNPEDVNDDDNNNDRGEINIYIMPIVSTNTGTEETAPLIFVASIFARPPEPSRRPRASERTMNSLPIVKITKEQVELLAACPICLDHFNVTTDNVNAAIVVNNNNNNGGDSGDGDGEIVGGMSDIDGSIEDKKPNVKQNKPVRQMPCKHMFCESCLFKWLRQNNTCPVCRWELPPEERQQEGPNNNNNNNSNNVDDTSTSNVSNSR